MKRITIVLALALALGVSLVGRESGVASAQQLGEGMDRTGTVGIRNDTERQLFASLICTCGCPREALSTCTCGFANERREELRAELVKGRPIEEIKAAYAARFGAQALLIPPNTGANRLLWILPLFAIALGAGFVGVVLRRWRRNNTDAGEGGGAATATAARAKSGKKGARAEPPPKDKYDEMLDDELKDLDE